MSLEYSASKASALRHKYALSVSAVEGGALPKVIREYYSAEYDIELRVLYENRAELRRQWLFLDKTGHVRLAASGEKAFFEDKKSAPAHASAKTEPEGKSPIGFVELYNTQGLITLERRFSSSGRERQLRYFYRGDALVRAETYEIAPPGTPGGAGQQKRLAVDYYRYTRFGALRAIDRRLSEGDADAQRIDMPRFSPNFAKNLPPVNPGVAYGSVFPDEAPVTSARIRYDTDSRGRVLKETHMDEEGNVTGTMTNTWQGDRLAVMHWEAGEGDTKEERKTEYEYDKEGNRTAERNYRNDALERVVIIDGKKETEELYMNGKAILRAIYENGRKVSEEPLPP
jgi:YD repeat-containing protein